MAGCVPLLVDCEHHPFPFDDVLDYSRFVVHAPMQAITDAPAGFVACLRKLRSDAPRLREMRRALHDAREELAYGWWGDAGPPSNMSLATAIRTGAWRLARYGRALDNLLRLTTVDPAARARPYNSWQIRAKGDAAELASQRPPRVHGFALLHYCRGDANATSFRGLERELEST